MGLELIQTFRGYNQYPLVCMRNEVRVSSSPEIPAFPLQHRNILKGTNSVSSLRLDTTWKPACPTQHSYDNDGYFKDIQLISNQCGFPDWDSDVCDPVPTRNTPETPGLGVFSSQTGGQTISLGHLAAEIKHWHYSNDLFIMWGEKIKI